MKLFSLQRAWRLIFVACTALAWTERACAQVSMQPILTNGPSSNRLNLVILSEGYKSNELGAFLVHATNACNTLLSLPPYDEYRSYFNVFAISVPSTDSGSDHPAYGSYVNTYFNSSYDIGDYGLITIPPNSFDPNYSNGQGKVDALLQTFGLTNAAMCILIVNDPAYGGSDGGGRVAIASANNLSFQYILPHESGHVLANLGDEYSDPNPGYPDIEEPNTTTQTNRALIKWNAWISTNTPIPTPPTPEYADVVGLFEGAHYHATGWYRPKLECMMRSLGVPFCEVCREALVLSFYQRVRPIDSILPAGTNITVGATQTLSFTLTLLQPTTHNLSVQWRTNGVAVAGATNSSFMVSAQSLGNGTNWVAVEVRDVTPLVRTDRSNVLVQTVTWRVITANLSLEAPERLADGRFRFRVTGTAPQGIVIQGSTNLVNWIPLSTNALLGGQLWYTNNAATNFPRRFFRAVTPP